MPLMLKTRYHRERQTELLRQPPLNSCDYLTPQAIAHLPKAIQHHLQLSGLMNHPLPMQADIRWKNVYFKRTFKGAWKKMDCTQYNAVTPPCRLAYMRLKYKGCALIQGRDKYQDGRGNMRIAIGGIVPIVNASGDEMTSSALLTLLAEAFLVPGYLLQPYITWNPISEQTIRATITHQGVSTTGTFHFNNNGQLSHFDTNERWMAMPDGSYRQTPWRAEINEYFAQEKLCLPGNMRAIWQLPEGDYEYFRGDIFGIDYHNHG